MMDFNWWAFVAGRGPGLVIWIVFLAAAIVWQSRSPGGMPVLLIATASITLIASALSMVVEASYLARMGSPDFHGGILKDRVRLMSGIHLCFQAGALGYAVVLLVAIGLIPAKPGR